MDNRRQAGRKPDSALCNGISSGTLSPLPTADVYELDPLRDPRWASLAETHPSASVFHSTSWIRALRMVYGYEPVAVTTCPPGTPLTNGLVFCRVKSWLTGRRFVSLPFSDHCEPLVGGRDELDVLLLYMRRYVDEAKWGSVAIRPASRGPGENTNFGKSATYCLHRLGLGRNTQDLFDHFHKDCVQRKIRRAEKERLSYEEGTSESLLGKFYHLLVATRRRHGLPPQPRDWFRGLIEAFGDRLKIRVASKDALPVASILTLSHRRAMVYKYGCSNVALNKFGGMAFLFWKTIQEAKERGFQELDMGRSETDNPGLIAFKDRWGADRTIINYWTYPQESVHHGSMWKTKLAGQVISAAPSVALETIGKLMYRHFG